MEGLIDTVILLVIIADQGPYKISPSNSHKREADSKQKDVTQTHKYQNNTNIRSID